MQRAKGKFSDNPGHNILKLYNVVVQVRFATSNTKLDIQYNKLGIRVASRVAERLKTQDLKNLESVRKKFKFGWRQLSAQSLLEKLNFGNSNQKTGKGRYQTFLVLSNFTEFVYFVSNILSGILFQGFNVKIIEMFIAPQQHWSDATNLFHS